MLCFPIAYVHSFLVIWLSQGDFRYIHYLLLIEIVLESFIPFHYLYQRVCLCKICIIKPGVPAFSTKLVCLCVRLCLPPRLSITFTWYWTCSCISRYVSKFATFQNITKQFHLWAYGLSNKAHQKKLLRLKVTAYKSLVSLKGWFTWQDGSASVIKVGVAYAYQIMSRYSTFVDLVTLYFA